MTTMTAEERFLCKLEDALIASRHRAEAAEAREKALGSAIATLCSERGLKRCDDDDCATCPLFPLLNEEGAA